MEIKEVGDLKIPYSLLAGGNGHRNARAYREAVRYVFSKEGWNVHEAWRKSEGRVESPPSVLREIDRYAYRQIGDLHGFSPRSSIGSLRNHFAAALNGAYDMVKVVADIAIPKIGFDYGGQFTEFYGTFTRPSSILEDISYHRNPEYQFASRQRLAFAMIVGDFLAYHDQNQARLGERNYRILQALNKGFFAENGKVEDWRKYVYFDSTLNEYKGFGDNPNPPDESTDVKLIYRQVRQIEDGEQAMWDPKIKDAIMAAIKATIESQRSPGGIIRTLSHIRDFSGGKLVVVRGGMEAVNFAAERAVEVIRREFPGVEVEDKSKSNQTRNQDPRIEEGRRRFQFNFPDGKYELVVRTLRAEMNARYRNGSIDPSTGIPEGWADEHYKAQRIYALWDFFFPKNIFKMNKEEAIRDRAVEISDELRRDRAVHLGRIQPGMLYKRRVVPVEFRIGLDVLTQAEGDSEFKRYPVVDTGRGKVILKKPDGTKFAIYPRRVGETGKIGSETFVGTEDSRSSTI